MDNLTHGFLGAAIGMLRQRDGGPEKDSPPTHTDKAVVWAAVLAAEMPDADVFFGGDGPLDGFIYHRGLSHALVVAPAIALVATGLVKLVWRQARMGTVYLWSLLSVLVAHMVNDWMTGWGTRLLLPWSEARLALDWVPIVDYLYLPPLAFAVILAWRKPRLRRRAVAGVLAYLAIYTIGYRGLSHTLVESAVRQHYAGQSVQQIRVAPNLFNPLAWQFTVDLGDRYEQGETRPFGPIEPTRVTAKAAEDDVIRAVQNAPELKPFFDQFPYPIIRYQPIDGGYEVTLGDVRYQFRGHGMTYIVYLTKDLQVTHITGGRE